MSNVQGKKAGDVWISGKKITCYYETDNKILNIILKHTLHTGPALVEFFGFFFFFMLTPLYTTTAPPRHIHTQTHIHIHTPLLVLFKEKLPLRTNLFFKKYSRYEKLVFPIQQIFDSCIRPSGNTL